MRGGHSRTTTYLQAGSAGSGASAEQELGSNFRRMDRDSYVPDLLAASDCMLVESWRRRDE